MAQKMLQKDKEVLDHVAVVVPDHVAVVVQDHVDTFYIHSIIPHAAINTSLIHLIL